jgi:UDP-N-acetylmuramate dehydrogenase
MSSLRAWLDSGAARFQGTISFDEPLSRHTYYRIGGPAAALVAPRGVADLEVLSACLRETSAPHFVLGKGSNLLVADAGFSGLVIKTDKLNTELALAPSGRLRTGTSVAVTQLLRLAGQNGWGGLEFLTGIPGSVGGVIVMNGGTHLGEASDRVRRVEAFDLRAGRLLDFEESSLRFQYRRNLFLPEAALVFAAEWDVRNDSPSKVKELIDSTLVRRKATQPIDYPSCGSVFKNPRGSDPTLASAWQVIDRLGLRGHRLGGAQIAEKHSNFILNLGDASAADVLGLIELAKRRARDELGISLEEEVRFLGF